MNLDEYLFYSVMSVLPLLGIWMVIFCSPFIPTVMSLLTRQIMTSEDVENHLIKGNRWWLLKLYTCLWCQAWWTSLAAGILQVLLVGYPKMWIFYSLSFYPIPFYAGLCVFYALCFYPFVAFASWKIHHLPIR